MPDRRTSDQSKAFVRRFVDEVQSRKQIERTAEFVAEEIVNHSAAPGAQSGATASVRNFERLEAAFPDHTCTIVQQVAEDDLVATFKTFTGTHQGEFLGVPPTGKRVTLNVIDIVRVTGDKITEHWAVSDVERVRQELLS